MPNDVPAFEEAVDELGVASPGYVRQYPSYLPLNCDVLGLHVVQELQHQVFILENNFALRGVTCANV